MIYIYILIVILFPIKTHPRCKSTLYTSYWDSELRSFSAVGEYDDNRLMLDAKLFPNKDNGLNGRHITIGTNYVSILYDIYLIPLIHSALNDSTRQVCFKHCHVVLHGIVYRYVELTFFIAYMHLL